ncbi:MAG: hypothetical protein FVQ83_10920 [Chloroflexi bacterium]|nr:hypothetical protein [Chloroflexota bacterium]
MFHPKDELRGKYLKAVDREFSIYIEDVNGQLPGIETNAFRGSLPNQGLVLTVSSGIVIMLIFVVMLIG